MVVQFIKLKKRLKIGCKKSDKYILGMNVFYYKVFFEVKKNPTLRLNISDFFNGAGDGARTRNSLLGRQEL